MRLAAVLVVLCLPAVVSAEVTEPNGLMVPQESMNGEEQLYTLFQSLAEPINWVIDAHATPIAFVPMCGFRATFLLNQSGSNAGVGWYNETGRLPTMSDIHLLLPSGSSVGTVLSSEDILHDPAYAGGLVGFALLSDQMHYTNPAYDPLCAGCNPQEPWITALIYASGQESNAYYVAFADGAVGTTPSSFNNDGAFNDEVYLFEGLTCAGGGEYCDTGKPGVCAPGTTVCTANGAVCQQATQPNLETCNGLDDDCNGLVDDGASCPTDQVCVHGACVPSCNTAGCPSGQVCTDQGTCVDSACATATCPVSQVCMAGECRTPCDGVVCPAMQICQGDRCIDPCAGVTCGSGEVCVRGACRQDCNCLPCADGLVCDATSGLCMSPACVGKVCGENQVCAGGSCVDACQGVHCPPGQACSAGQCADIAPAVPDAGSDAGVLADAGAVDAGTMDAGTMDAGTMDAGTMDAGLIDAGLEDAGVIDAGSIDAGSADAGAADSGPEDAGVPDTGLDAGSVDSGSSGDGGAGVVDAGGGSDAGITGAGHRGAAGSGCSEPGIAGWGSVAGLLFLRGRRARPLRRAALT